MHFYLGGKAYYYIVIAVDNNAASSPNKYTNHAAAKTTFTYAI